MIDGKTISELSPNNQNALRITFDLRTYTNIETQGAIISVYNLPQSFYQNQSQLVDKRIQLYAGFSPTSQLLRRLEIKPVLNTLLLSGYISNTIGDYPNNKIDLIISSTPIKTQDKTKGVLFDLKKGESVKQKIKSALKSLYPLSQVNIGGIESVAVENMIKTLYSNSDLNDIAATYGILIYTDFQGFYIADRNPKGSEFPPIEISQNEIVGNPTYADFSTINLTLLMRGDLKLGTLISIPTAIFATVSPNQNYIVNAPRSFISGKFLITKIWHIGDSANENPQSWVTNIQAVPLQS